MVIILGLGFTGTRLARRLLKHEVPVSAIVRGAERFGDLADSGLQIAELAETQSMPRNAILAHLVPPLPEPENSVLRETIVQLAPARIVYVSSTGVYGDQIDVDSDTPAKPNDDRGRLRVAEERWVASGPWTSLIVRSAAIYGPGRGVHAAIRAGKLPRGMGSGIVSRIHVEDLARILEAGIFSNLQGAWPVADDAPCSTAEIARWCANLLQMEVITDNVPVVSGRRVDGSKIRKALGITLRYPSWQKGIEASIGEEKSTNPKGADEGVGSRPGGPPHKN